MHFIVSWRIYDGFDKAQSEKTFLDCIAPNRFYIPLDGASSCVIHVPTQQEYARVVSDLQKAGQPAGMQFFATPPMLGGRYDGLLPAATWNAINSLTV